MIRIFRYLILLPVFFLMAIPFIRAQQLESYNGDLEFYRKPVTDAISRFYQMALECVLDEEMRSTHIQGITNTYLQQDFFAVPDFVQSSTNNGIYNFEYYINQMSHFYRSDADNNSNFSTIQEGIIFNSAQWTTDKKGVIVHTSFTNKLMDGNNVLFSGRTNIVICFPSIHNTYVFRYCQVTPDGWSPNEAPHLHVSYSNENSITPSLDIHTSENVASASKYYNQDRDKLRDEGDTALKDKNYAEAFEKYDSFLKQTNYEDADRVFNCGFVAYQAKKYEDAAKYYNLAIQKNKNVDDAYIGKAMALRNLNKVAEFTATIEAGLKAKPGNADLEKLRYVYCMKQGQAAQKSGKVADAEELYKDVLVVSNPKYKGNALYSLGAMFYNEGAKILQAATDPAKYEAEKDKAYLQMKKAKNYLEQALTINAADTNSKKILDSINEVLKYEQDMELVEIVEATSKNENANSTNSDFDKLKDRRLKESGEFTTEMPYEKIPGAKIIQRINNSSSLVSITDGKRSLTYSKDFENKIDFQNKTTFDGPCIYKQDSLDPVNSESIFLIGHFHRGKDLCDSLIISYKNHNNDAFLYRPDDNNPYEYEVVISPEKKARRFVSKENVFSLHKGMGAMPNKYGNMLEGFYKDFQPVEGQYYTEILNDSSRIYGPVSERLVSPYGFREIWSADSSTVWIEIGWRSENEFVFNRDGKDVHFYLNEYTGTDSLKYTIYTSYHYKPAVYYKTGLNKKISGIVFKNMKRGTRIEENIPGKMISTRIVL